MKTLTLSLTQGLFSFMNTAEEWHAFVLGWAETACPWWARYPLDFVGAEYTPRKEYHYYAFGRVMGFLTIIIIAIAALAAVLKILSHPEPPELNSGSGQDQKKPALNLFQRKETRMKVEITFNQVTDLQVKAKDSEVGVLTSITFQCPGRPPDIARLMSLLRQKAPLSCTFACTQAVFDLDVAQAGPELISEVTATLSPSQGKPAPGGET